MHTFNIQLINRLNQPFIIFTSVSKIIERSNYSSMVLYNNCIYDIFIFKQSTEYNIRVVSNKNLS